MPVCSVLFHLVVSLYIHLSSSIHVYICLPVLVVSQSLCLDMKRNALWLAYLCVYMYCVYAYRYICNYALVSVYVRACARACVVIPGTGKIAHRKP